MCKTGLWLSGRGHLNCRFCLQPREEYLYLFISYLVQVTFNGPCVRLNVLFEKSLYLLYNRATAVLEDVHARICVFMFTETHVWEEESAGAPLDLINEVADSRYISGQVTASLLQVHRCAQQLLIYETVSKPSANIREREKEREMCFFLQWAKVKAECRSPLREENNSE